MSMTEPNEPHPDLDEQLSLLLGEQSDIQKSDIRFGKLYASFPERSTSLEAAADELAAKVLQGYSDGDRVQAQGEMSRGIKKILWTFTAADQLVPSAEEMSEAESFARQYQVPFGTAQELAGKTNAEAMMMCLIYDKLEAVNTITPEMTMAQRIWFCHGAWAMVFLMSEEGADENSQE